MNAADLQPQFQNVHRTISASKDTLLITLVECADTQVKCKNAIHELRQSNDLSHELKMYLQRVVVAESDQQVIAKLEAHLEGDSVHSAIVISDKFASPTIATLRARPESTHLGDEIRSRFGNKLLGMIAITDWAPKRVPDIDRTAPSWLTPDELAKALQQTVRTLKYKAPTEKASLNLPITVGRVQRQIVLKEYFKLRHDVYSTMGYLDAKLEASPTKIEADLCDLNSIHICAIEQSEVGTRVVGAARLILTENVDERLRHWSEKIARVDPILRYRFRPPYPQLQLPVWQSQGVQNKIAQMYRSGERHGEISRVVVAESHRGTGLARLLINHVIHEARERQLSRLFLECVPLHRVFYHKFGFDELPGTHERVVNVDKTVVAMELKFNNEQANIGSLPINANIILSEQNNLCACDKRECYSDKYALYKTDKCCLHYRPGQPR